MRELCPALANKTYFNYGGQGPLPTPSLEAITASWQRIQELGPFTTEVWPFIEQETTRVRQALAALCGVPPHRLALTENVTSGCVLPLWGLPWSAGDSLLISDCEHPGVVAACQELARREELNISVLPVFKLSCHTPHGEFKDSLLEALEQRLTPRTRLVVLSHLLWNSGRVMPIAAVAARLRQHPCQPWLLVDAAQSMGSIPVEEAANAADIYAFTGHKWCCGPEGLGGMALSERILNEGQPTLIGWRSLRHETSAGSSFHNDARRFEVATSCVPLYRGLTTSLELLASAGSPAQRLRQIQAGSAQLWGALREIPWIQPLLQEAPPAGLVSFRLASDHQPLHSSTSVVQALGEQGIWIRRLEDPDCLRACIHITTTPGEIHQLTEALPQITRSTN